MAGRTCDSIDSLVKSKVDVIFAEKLGQLSRLSDKNGAVCLQTTGSHSRVVQYSEVRTNLCWLIFERDRLMMMAQASRSRLPLTRLACSSPPRPVPSPDPTKCGLFDVTTKKYKQETTETQVSNMKFHLVQGRETPTFSSGSSFGISAKIRENSRYYKSSQTCSFLAVVCSSQRPPP